MENYGSQCQQPMVVFDGNCGKLMILYCLNKSTVLGNMDT